MNTHCWCYLAAITLTGWYLLAPSTAKAQLPTQIIANYSGGYNAK
jgi:hypothetical protein